MRRLHTQKAWWRDEAAFIVLRVYANIQVLLVVSNMIICTHVQ